MGFIIHPGLKWCIPCHHLTHCINTFLTINTPCRDTISGHIVLEHLSHVIFFFTLLIILYEIIWISGKFNIVHISNNNVQVSVICMVEIIDHPALYKIKLVSEITYIRCLHIYNIRIRKCLLKQIGDNLRSMSRLHKLTINKADSLIVRETISSH